AGETQMSFIDAVSSLPHRAAGTLKLLAVGTATRSSLLPDLPTLAESGVAGFDSDRYGADGPGRPAERGGGTAGGRGARRGG
ncbi:MAG: tripartite tricarboxylate transporter substrate binding protein, partial [Acetobacteraceae bacterium]